MTKGAWAVLCLLGAYHGVNPGMGWLFSVALGMQERSRQAVGRSLIPLALGHALAIGLVILVAVFAQAVIPRSYVKVSVALLLFAFGLYRLRRDRHPRWGGMKVGFRDLTFWSFLMASAHGAGFMVLPLLLGMSAGEYVVHSQALQHGSYLSIIEGPWTSMLAILVHTLGYLVVTGAVALLVYEKLGLALLRKAWLNLNLVWAMALIAVGVLTFFLPG